MKQRLLGILLLLLFGLPFLAVGLFMSWQVIRSVSGAWRARNWIETPARIMSVELESDSDGEGSSYRVRCRYRYRVGDREFESRRVGLSTGSDGIGSWQRDTYHRLKTAYDRGEQVTCYVNPHNPNAALLDRSLRMGMLFFQLIFVVLFGGVGGAILIGSLFASRSTRRDAALKAEHPDEPWLHRPDWASGRISSGLRTKELVGWALAVFWNTISSGVFFIVPDAVAQGEYLALIFLLFPLVGIGILCYAILQTARRRRFGRSYLLLETVPGVIGGYLRGRVCIVGSIEAIDHIQLELECNREHSTGTGEDRKTDTEVLWSEKAGHNCASTFGQTQIDLPFSFQIPHDCRATEVISSDEKIGWKLGASAVLPGPDLALSFEVPVFRTEASDDHLGSAPQRQREEEAFLAAVESPAPRKIRALSDSNGNPQYRISCFPSIGFVLAFALFAIGCLSVAVFSYSRVLSGDWFMLIFLLAFGGIGLLLVCAVLTTLGSFRLTLRPGGLTVERFWLFMHWQRDVAGDQIESVELKQCASSGESRWYEIFCRTSGKRLTLARNVPGELPARWLVRRVEEHLSKSGPRMPSKGPPSPANL